MKTKEELSALKNEVEALNRKLAELTEEELAEVTGGFDFIIPDDHSDYEIHIYPSPILPPDPTKFE